MSGVLSQAVANLVAVEQQVTSLTGLPASAQQVQSSSAALIGPLVSQIQAVQQSCAGFVQSAVPQLTEIQSMVSSGQSVTDIEANMATVAGEASSLQSILQAATTQIASTSRQLDGCFNQLTQIEAGLKAAATELQGQIGTAQGQEAADQRKYDLLLALSAFGGAFGLAAASAALTSIKAQLNALERQGSATNAQINSLDMMATACQTLASSLQDVVTKVSSVSNAVDFLNSDLLTINSDLQSGDSMTVVGVLVATAITEVNTLGVDTS
jgi:chromosome segregation ATPase